MKKDFKKKRYIMEDESPKRYGRMVVSGLIALVILAGAGYMYQQKKPHDAMQASRVSAWLNQAGVWVAEHKGKWKQQISKVKQLTQNKTPAEDEIHFDFYSTLPNMKMSPPDLADEKSDNVQVSKRVSLKSKTLTSKKVVVASATELENELSSQLKQSEKNEHE